MVKFKSIAWPSPSEGKSYIGIEELTMPDQSLSLREILTRFTRNEQLPVGQDAQYHDSDIDLRKLQNSDLVDKQEYIEQMKEVQRTYEREEKARINDQREFAKAKILEEERAKLKKDGENPASAAKTS